MKLRSQEVFGQRSAGWLPGLVVAIVAWALAAAGCAPDVKQDPPPEDRPQAIFDAQTSTVPLPNDVAIEPDGTLPDLEGAGGDSAEGQFLEWLGSLHGWLPSTPIELPFDQPLDPQTVNSETVRVYRVGDDGSLTRLELSEVRHETRTLTVSGPDGEPTEIEGAMVVPVPKESLEVSERYAVVATDGLKGPEGKTVLASQAIFFAASKEPLVDENGQKTIESLPDDATAQTLEALRQQLAPVFEGIQEDGLERNRVVAASLWSTLPDPQTVVDPATATVPIPNTAALDEDGTFPDSALSAVGEDSAQGDLDTYLSKLHAWPNATPITLPVANAIDPETLDTDSVQLWKVPRFDQSDEDGQARRIELASVQWDADNSQVVVTPNETLPLQSRFVAFATDDVKGPQGNSLKMPAALFMSVQPFDVFKDGASQVSRISDEQARAIQGLRQFNRPAAQAVKDAAAISFDRLGALWTWRTWTDSFMTFDPATGEIPIPNEFARLGGNGEVTLPVPDDPVQKPIIQELNSRFGFSTTASGWMPVSGGLKEDTVTRDSAFLAWFQGLSKYGEDVYDLEYNEEFGQITYTPKKPLFKDSALDTTNADALSLGIATTDIMGANGEPVEPMPAFVLLTSTHPLVAGMKTDPANISVEDILVGSLRPSEDASDEEKQSAIESAASLERGRQRFNQLIGFLDQSGTLEKFGITRDELAVAFAFHPADSTRPAQELRAQALAKLEERGMGGKDATKVDSKSYSRVVDPGADYTGPDGSLDPVDMSDVSLIQWTAEIDTVDFLGDDPATILPYGMAQSTTVGISVLLPKRQGNGGMGNVVEKTCAQSGSTGNKEPFPVVINQHGLGNWRVGATMGLANSLAAKGMAVVSMDFIGHGGRSPNQSDLHPATKPSSSGSQFFSVDLVASKNKALQSIVDAAVLAEVVRSGGLEQAIDDDPNTDCFADGPDAEVGYIGNSLGGFVGFVTTAIDSTINVGVYNGTGGKWSRVLTEGALGGPLAALLPMEGTFARFQTVAFLQWLAEPIDPFTFARFIQDSPLEEMTFEPGMGVSRGDRLSSADALVQMAEGPMGGGDDIVPNSTTELLVEASGLSVDDSTYPASHGFLYNQDPMSAEFEAAECARRQAAQWLLDGLTGQDAPTIPDSLKAQNCLQD